MQQTDKSSQAGLPPVAPAGGPLALPTSEPEPQRGGVAVARYGRGQGYRFESQLALASVIVGLLSGGAGVLFLESLFHPNSLALLVPGDGVLLTILVGGVWLCLAVLAVIFSVVTLRRLPKGGGYRKEKVQAFVGLGLGITNLLALLGGFVLLLVILLTPPPPGGYDQVGIWL